MATVTFTDGSVASGGNNLTSLANVKEYLGLSVTTYDAVLSSLISRVSAEIERICNRKFKSRTFKEWYDGDGNLTLMLRNYPITSIQRLSLGSISAVDIRQGASDAATAYVEVDSDVTNLILTVVGGVNAGTVTLNLTTYLTITTLVNAINAAGSGWSATILSSLGDERTNVIRPTYGQYALDGTTAYLYVPWLGNRDWIMLGSGLSWGQDGVVRLSRSGGVDDEDWYGFPEGKRNIYAEYTAGYSTIPADLEDIAIEMASEKFHLRKRDPSLQSESLSGYSYTIARSSEADRTKHWRTRLADWRRLLV